MEGFVLVKSQEQLFPSHVLVHHTCNLPRGLLEAYLISTDRTEFLVLTIKIIVI